VPEPPADESTQVGLRKSRLEALSDGVFSVALTILALDLVIPHTIASSGGQLSWHDIGGLVGPLFIVLLGFVVVGSFWLGNHLIFHYIDHTDRYVTWINLLYLFAIVILPYSTLLVANFHDSTPAIVFFGLNQIAAGLLAAASFRYADGAGLLKTRTDEHTRRFLMGRILIGPAFGAVGIAAAFVYPLAGLAVYGSIIILYLIPSHIDTHLRPGEHPPESPR
jgi:uncharacterized membrane protein